LCVVSFFTLEPVVSRSAVEIFTIIQTVTGEISFLASTTAVTMSPTLPGVTGGTANGVTTARVQTNNSAGYNMTIEFASTTAMIGDSNGGVISDYTPTDPNVPDYSFSVGANTGEFAYTVEASTTAELDPTFQDTGAACGSGGGNTTDTCWYNASSSGGTTIAETIINSSSATPVSGSTSTLRFRVQITSNPSPAIPTDTYTATATLTALTN